MEVMACVMSVGKDLFQVRVIFIVKSVSMTYVRSVIKSKKFPSLKKENNLSMVTFQIQVKLEKELMLLLKKLRLL